MPSQNEHYTALDKRCYEDIYSEVADVSNQSSPNDETVDETHFDLDDIAIWGAAHKTKLAQTRDVRNRQFLKDHPPTEPNLKKDRAGVFLVLSILEFVLFGIIGIVPLIVSLLYIAIPRFRRLWAKRVCTFVIGITFLIGLFLLIYLLGMNLVES